MGLFWGMNRYHETVRFWLTQMRLKTDSPTRPLRTYNQYWLLLTKQVRQHMPWSCVVALCVVSACQPKPKQEVASPVSTNPLVESSTLSYQAPAFNHISDGHFKPAFQAGLTQQLAEINHIADNAQPPTFANTLVALEKSGQLLNRVNRIFNQFLDARSSPTLQQLQAEIAPQLTANQDAIFLNRKLFQRINSLYQHRHSLKLDSESAYLLTCYHQQFVLAGATLSDSAKTALKHLNQQEAILVATFSQTVREATQAGAVLITNPAELAGLPQSERQAAAREANARKHPGRWLLSLQNTTQQPVLKWLTNRAIRQKVFMASLNRAQKGDAHDTQAIIIGIARLRARKAALLGFKNYAAWTLRDRMVQTPAGLTQFLAQLTAPSIRKVQQEAATLQALIDQQNGGFRLQPWDWDFYVAQSQKSQTTLQEDELKPYFELNKVLQNGLFYAALRLYGLTLTERHDLPVYQPDVRVFEVIDAGGQGLGLVYFDFFQRANKRGGAWANSFVDQSTLLGTKPVVYTTCNFSKPPAGQPTLLSPANIITLFHEFGHGLHRLFSNQRYISLSASNIAPDFVEFPSQFNENWAFYPDVLSHYAVHFRTRRPMPNVLINQLRQTATVNQGYAMTELLAADNLDLRWHSLDSAAVIGTVNSFERTALLNAKLSLSLVPPRYRSSYFLHIWSDGYAAGYYGYRWSEMLACDTFSWFQSHGGLNRRNGQRFRELLLGRGHSADYSSLYRAFRGHNPDIRPLLIRRGLMAK